MKKKKCIAAGALAAFLLCESLFTPNLAGMGAGLLQVQAAAANVALNKEATSSANETTALSADKAVDGDKESDEGRWSSGDMGSNRDNPQWLVIDLAAQKTDVESISVYFNKKAWSTEYQIQTSDSNASDAQWETVYEMSRASADVQRNDPDVFQASDLSSSALKRYVRFYFKKGNLNGWKCISVKEIEIMGTQSGKTAAGVLKDIPDAMTVESGEDQLSLPSDSENYDISIHGSEADQILGTDGKAAALRIGDRSFNVILKAVNKNNPQDTAKKNVTVTVKGNTDQYPELFKNVTNPNPMPKVLPTIQEWYGYEGNFELTEQSRIVVNDVAGVDAEEAAKEMQSDIHDICGLDLKIVKGTSAGAQDIYLESQTEDIYDTGKEGYLLVNGEEGIKIYSSAKTGLLYGTVTVEQMLYQDDEHKSVPKGVIRDYPLYEMRGIMFDIARIPTRMPFLNDYTKIMKWYKLNEMQLHINDNQWSQPAYSANYEDWAETEASHRLQSELFPSLAAQKSKFVKTGDSADRYDYYYNVHTGKNGELYYTKDEFRKMNEEAKARGIQVVAELDTPGHSAAYTKYVHDHQEEVIKSLVKYGYLNRADYLGADGNVKQGASFYIHNPNNWELLSLDDQSSNAEVKQNAINAKIFMKALFDEYLGGIDGIEAIFDAKNVNAGVDEYWDKSGGNKEAFRRYMNEMYSYLHDKYDVEVEMWGALQIIQGSTPVNNNIILNMWSHSEDNPTARLAEGFRLINTPQTFLYNTPGRYHKDMIQENNLFYNWDPSIFSGGVKTEKGDPQVLGAKTALWGDENREGITEADLNERYLRAAAMVSQKTWGSDKETSFVSYEQTFDALREGPGTAISYEIESASDVVADYDFANLSADGKTIYDASGNGYDAQVTGGVKTEKDGETYLKFDGNTIIETPLTTLGYPYTMSFDVYLDGTENNTKESSLFSGYDGRLQVAGINGSLSLNRDYFNQSFDYQIKNNEKHRITIVGTYQATKLYVDGVFKKILYAAASDPENSGTLGASTWTDADNNYRTTFVFPLNEIGKNFSGYLGNIKAYNKALSVEELTAENNTTSLVDVARNRGAYTDLGNKNYKGDEMRLYPAWKATDGDGHVKDTQGVTTSYESRWYSSDRNDDFLMVDLGTERNISKVVIDWAAGRYATKYNIQTSLNGTNWTTVKSITANESAWTEDTFTATKARYVRMQGVQRKASEYGICEIKVYEAVDKTKLKNACEQAKSMLQNVKVDFENGSKSVGLWQSYRKANTVITDVLAGQEEVDMAASELKAAQMNYTQKKTEYKDNIAKEVTNAEKDLSGYTQESAQRYQEALERAENLAKDADVQPGELEEAWKELKEAKTALVSKEEQKQALRELQEILQELADVDFGKFSNQSGNALKEAIQSAQQIAEKTDATMKELQDAKQKVEEARSKVVNITPLKTILAEAEQKNFADYTVGSAKRATDIVNEARAALEDATEQQVSNIKKSWDTCVSELVDIRNLRTAISNAENIDKALYTEASMEKLTQSLAEAKEVFGKEDPARAEVDGAAESLNLAIKGLERKDSGKEPETPTPTPTPEPTPTPNPAPTPAVPSVPAKGSTFTDAKGFTYKVMKSDAKNGTVAVTGNSKKKGKLIVPATVVKDGYTFKVTEVAAKAFQNNKKLTTLVLGANVSKIGAKSFYKNAKLKNITFKNKNAVKIGSQAFKGIKATAKVTVPKKMTAKNFNKLKKGMKSAGKKIKYKKK